jgi:hypothetical protein
MSGFGVSVTYVVAGLSRTGLTAPCGQARRKVPEAIRIAERKGSMLYTLAVILLIAWLLGIVGTYTIGAFVHILLVIALVLLLVGLLSGRRTII